MRSSIVILVKIILKHTPILVPNWKASIEFKIVRRKRCMLICVKSVYCDSWNKMKTAFENSIKEFLENICFNP